jgi:heme/copper-type cytochrome/quinol oxidase subunit 3
MSRSPVAEPVSRFGMWLFLVTDAMSFGALLLAYGVLRAHDTAGFADAAARPNLLFGAAATIVLLASSWTLARGRVAVTLALGALFLGAQAFEYVTLARHGVGFAAAPAASIFFATTGWHGLHVAAGLVLLAVAGKHASVALFWQFVDAVWIVLFAVFYVGPAVRAPTVLVAVAVAAVAGFAAVVAVPMNLRKERRAVRVMFVLPLALPILYLVALVADTLAGGIRP